MPKQSAKQKRPHKPNSASSTYYRSRQSAPARQSSQNKSLPTIVYKKSFTPEIFLALIGLGLGATVGIALTPESHNALVAPGGIAMFLGNITGLIGTYLALVMVLLVSRIPFIEKVLGQDGLVAWHKKLAPWPISLIVLHAILLTVAYAQAAKTGALHELNTLITSFPDMLTATIGFAIMVIVGIISIRAIRQRLKRETWWTIHLYIYVALALAFAHEIVLGPSFVGHPLTQIIWSIAWALTAGLVLLYRFITPFVKSAYYGLRVYQVRKETDNTISIILKGKNIEKMKVRGGQFFEWRFLKRGMWWQAHPFSISAKPKAPYVRITVKQVGDFTSELSGLKPGTKVLIEGPYGVFTKNTMRQNRIALIAGGIGITSVRSLLEDVPPRTDIVTILRATSESDTTLHQEVKDLVGKRGGLVHEVFGSRQEVPLESIVDKIEDIEQRDVFIAGSANFVENLQKILKTKGLKAEQVHAEIYAL